MEEAGENEEALVEHIAPPKKPLITGTDGRWTDEEHELFREAVLLFGKNWNKVATHVGTRTSA